MIANSCFAKFYGTGLPALHRRCRPVVAIEAFMEELEFSRGTLCDIHTCKASDRTTFCDKSHFSLFLAAFCL